MDRLTTMGQIDVKAQQKSERKPRNAGQGTENAAMERRETRAP